LWRGHNTRLLAQRGAAMTALDISPTFIRFAREEEQRNHLGIEYHIASGVNLAFADRMFDFATAFMCLMDMAEPDRAIREAFRVIKPSGFFQFSITHPCFQTPLWKWVRDEKGNKLGVICGQYFDQKPGRIEEWIFQSAPEGSRKFRIPVFDRTLSEWLNTLLDTGFQIERVVEPHADEKTAAEHPSVTDTRLVAYSLIVLCRKPL
jgi:SAM-dependent methyltransferase